MKTQKKNKLDFRKHSLVELNDFQLKEVNGGSTAGCMSITTLVCVAIVSLSFIASAMTRNGTNYQTN
ncbi:class I lanthipeptide [Lacinutrix sp. Hel_I_90]|uniref:class I lanthipeptide n=1 Tax=Lacinutrix sp. Hel_I_90 TaxID=1249999 RepID=UPI0005C81D4D|nr:class I lanthipeptide [Lacinutrix sp. Hel_I_90]